MWKIELEAAAPEPERICINRNGQTESVENVTDRIIEAVAHNGDVGECPHGVDEAGKLRIDGNRL